MVRLFSWFASAGIIALALLPVASAEDPLEALKPSHPRLLVGPGRWEALKQQAARDPLLRQLTDRLQLEAAALLEEPPLERRIRGRRMLSVSRAALQRTMLWSLASHLSGDPRYARRAQREMLALARFRDWNPSHFLDTAEMTTALALGYDWLHDELTPAARAEIRDGIIRNGLQPGQKAIARDAWWASRDNNWNQVCLGGLTMGALVVAEEAPELADFILTAARTGIHHGLSVYAPDGIYPEGPGYWGYGTLYQCLMIDALRTALGTSWGLEKAPGFLDSAVAQLQQTGPTGRFFNFSDGHAGPSFQPAMFWFAREMNSPGLLTDQLPLLETRLAASDGKSSSLPRLSSLIALWWPSNGHHTDPQRPLAWHGRGRQPLAVFRSSWSDPNALYLACKAGRASESHGHMDAGSFVLEADGVRWAVDLGSQNYHSLESKGIRLWDRSQKGQRWDVFRLNNRSHNTLTIDGQLHRAGGTARFTDFGPHHAELDLSPIFKGQAQQVRRDFEVRDTQVMIRDALRGLTPGSSVRWTMATRAETEVTAHTALLRQDGKTLQLTFTGPNEASLRCRPADPPDDHFNAPNPDTRLIQIDIPVGASGSISSTVTLRPLNPSQTVE